MNKQRWLKLARELVEANGWNWDYCESWYSFESAYDNKMTAEWAAHDCMEWLEG